MHQGSTETARNQPPCGFDRYRALREQSSDQARLARSELMASWRFPCIVTLGAELVSSRNVDFVGIQENGEWLVIELATRPPQKPCFKVDRLELCVNQADAPAVAILDDDEDTALNTRDYLIDSGFKAQTFSDASQLRNAIQGGDFDAYIMDWIIGKETSLPLIQEIRDADLDAPIVLLTGELQSGLADEDELGDVSIRYKLIFHQKPAPLKVIAKQLSQLLADQH
jgi:CheY-like chemotaxis protein